MIIKKYPAPPVETAAERYDRDWLNVPELDTDGFDDRRHDRTLLQQALERKSRRYVDGGISAVTGGSPVFDPEEAPRIPRFLWKDVFEGPALNDRWTMASGSAEFSPLRSSSSASVLSLGTVVSELSHCEIIANIDPDGQSTGLLAFSIATESMESLISFQVRPGSVTASTPEDDFFVTFAEGNISDATLFVQWLGGEVVLSVNEYQMEPIPVSYTGPVMLAFTPVHPVQIHSVEVHGFSDEPPTEPEPPTNPDDNGGGTPEPEEPEVPEGSYQENYTETY